MQQEVTDSLSVSGRFFSLKQAQTGEEEIQNVCVSKHANFWTETVFMT